MTVPSSNIKQVFVIIPAAGNSTRMGGSINKIFMDVDGKPVLSRTLDAFKIFADRLIADNISLHAVVVTNEVNIEPIRAMISDGNYSFVNEVVQGGATRTDSVYNGLMALKNMPTPPSDDDVVFIHDGARCLIDQETLDNCIDGVVKNPVCVVAVPVKNTIKIVNSDNEVTCTPKRSELMEVQTPQVFRYDKLLNSYVNAIENNIEATDDTSLAEALGYKVTIVKGSYSNIKITTPEDIAIAEGILRDIKK